MKVLVILLMLAIGTACAGAAKPGDTVSANGSAQAGAIDASSESADYYLLLGEMAIKKELYDEASKNYRQAALLSDDPEVAKLATEVAFELGRDEDALVSALRWKALTRKSAPNPQVHAYLARLYVRQKNVKKAAASLKAMIKSSDAEPSDAFLPVAGVLAGEDNADVALAAIERVVASYKRVPQAHYALGLQALRNGDYDRARDSAKRTTELDSQWGPGHLLLARALIASGEVDTGIEYAGEHIGGTNAVGERLEYGMLLAAVDRDLEASMVLEQVLIDDPSNVSALRALGILDLKEGNLELAEQRFMALMSNGQGSYDALYFLGSIAETNEQLQRAYRLYSEVRAGDNAVISQLRAANILFRSDKLDEALQHLERFANQNPKYTLEMAMGQGELLASGDRKDEAMMLYDNILKQNPDETRAQFARAFLLESMDRIDEAIQQMRIILATDPTDASALNALGYTLADRTDQYQEAHQLISLAYEKEPDSGPIADSMGWVEYKMGNLPRAAELLEQAYKLLPDAEVVAHLIEVAHASGDHERVAQLLLDAEDKFADSDDIDEVIQRLGL